MLKFTKRTSAMILLALALAVSPTISKQFEKADPVKTPAISAQTQQSNVMVASVVAKKDDRSDRLANYFAANNSPFTPFADDFVQIADKYDLDWTFLPAIANLESQLGKQVPAYSYNPYGWNNGKYRFQSWNDATAQVAAGIRGRYAITGLVTPYRIGKMYAASPTWAVRVAKYQIQILNF